MVTFPVIYRSILRLIRFSIVGFINTVASYLVFALFIWAGVHYVFASLAASSIGMLMGFKLHGAFVFDHPGDHRFLRFMGIAFLIFSCSLGIQALARTNVNDYLAGAIAAAITIPISFLLNRAFVFHAPEGLDRER